MIVRTATGSTYRVEDDVITRVMAGEGSHILRQDGEAIQVIEWITRPEVGDSMRVLMTLLDPPQDPNANATYRITSPVVSIEEEA